jgi:cell division protein FtsL
MGERVTLNDLSVSILIVALIWILNKRAYLKLNRELQKCFYVPDILKSKVE